MDNTDDIVEDLVQIEKKVLEELRSLRRKARPQPGSPLSPVPDVPPLSKGQRVADAVAATMGSWKFIIIQSTLLAGWVTLNVTAWHKHWDPYPFILLNLALSFQAAYAAPFIMMSQNRQQEIDMISAKTDHQVNLKAELEIELVHQKLNALRETEVMYLTSGEMSPAEFTNFLTAATAMLIAFSGNGSIHFLFMDWRHIKEMSEATSQYTEFKNLICWNKQNASLGSFYRSKHELIFVMKNGTASHINNFGLGEKGRHRSNVWDYAGANSWGKTRSANLAMHPTVKPVAMVADAMKDCSHKGGLVLDNFGGSGTTIMAAEQTQRRARLIELDPAYVDVSVRRWQAATGGKAVLDNDGRSFDEVSRRRVA